MKKWDAIILGTGIAGLGTAAALAQAGKQVLLIGKKNMKGEASLAAAGILDPFLEMHPKNPLLPIMCRAFQEYPAWLRRLTHQKPENAGYRRTGMLYAALNIKEETLLRSKFCWQKKWGIPVREVRHAWIRRKAGALPERARYGLFYPTVGRVRPPDLLRVLRRYAQRLGVTVQTHLKSSSLIVRKNRVIGIKIGEKKIASSCAVNATGSWAGANRRLLIRPPVIPARGQVLVVRSKQPKISIILHSLDGAYVVPWGLNQYLLGSTLEFVGMKPSVTKKGIESIKRRIRRLAPALKEFQAVSAHAGLRPFSPDRLPLVGATSVRGLYLATGFYRSGILLGCLMGRLLAKGIVSGKMPKTLQPFDPRRFRS